MKQAPPAGSPRLAAWRRFANSEAALSVLFFPALAMMVLLVLVPLISGVNISFTNWNGYSQSYKYIGPENYTRLFGDRIFLTALKNTLIYGFGSTVIQTVFGLLYALLLQQKFFLRTAARTIIYLPAMVSQLIMGYIWYFLVQYDGGAINDILRLLGAAPVDWMGAGTRAVLIITCINAIQFVGKTMIIFLAGIQGIPQSYYEAASLDGASYWQSFRHITVPQLMPAFTTSIVLNIIGGLKLFGIIVSLTSGGPGYSSHSLSTLINSMYFSNQDAGYAAAIGIFTFLFIMLASVVIRGFLEKRTVDLT